MAKPYILVKRELPSGYKQLEYIESNGTQYIDTEIIGQTGIKVVGEFLASDFSTCIPIGCFGTQRCYVLSFDGTYVRYGYVNFYTATKTIETNKKHSFEVDFSANNQYLNIDGETLITSNETTTFKNSYNIYLSAYNDAGNAGDYAKIRWYPLQIFLNGKVVREYVPCKNSNGEIGLYDFVSHRLFTNKGSGSFIAGNEITNESKNVTTQISKGYLLAPNSNGIDGNTLFLLHGDAIEDASNNNLTVTNNGVTVSSSQSKFSGKSLYFNGSSTLRTKSLNFGTGDFTVDFWMCPSSASGYFISGYSSGLSGSFGIGFRSTTTFGILRCAVAWDSEFTVSIQPNVWTHIAVVRKDGIVYLFVNGSLIGSAENTNSYSTPTETVIGAEGSSGYYTGYIDEYRISKVARWTENFTPPTKPYSTELVGDVLETHAIKKAYINAINFEPRELPSGYTQVEWLEGSGTQYINTEIIPTTDTKVVTEFEWVDIEKDNWFSPFGSRTSSASQDQFNIAVDTTHSYAGFANSELTLKKGYHQVGKRYVVEMDKNGIVINGELDSSYASGLEVVSTYPMFLFGRNNAGTFGSAGKVRICRQEIYKGGALVRDYVASVKSDGTVGMYDFVSGRLFTNAGSGNFIVGNTRKLVSKLCWSSLDVTAMGISYTGNMTDEVVTMGDGKEYRLLTLTSSGTLTLDEEVSADVWACNGGGTGGASVQQSSGTKFGRNGGNGGVGGNFCNVIATLPKNAVFTIGAGGGGATSIDGITLSNWIAGAGGGGGGNGYNGYNGWGGSKAGGDTRPFQDSYFTSYPCAGGGAGGGYSSNGIIRDGGGGGSSLSAGTVVSGSGDKTGASGGVTGGGNGGTMYGVDATAGSYYGSGGGGGGYKSSTGAQPGAAGYQGACFIRIPLEQ